ncbi:MAG: hypothetical protein KDC27_14430 [Acidobacteria bacterium]|nr:hypothetical protein [Acidobacteriota bacterium]
MWLVVLALPVALVPQPQRSDAHLERTREVLLSAGTLSSCFAWTLSDAKASRLHGEADKRPALTALPSSARQPAALHLSRTEDQPRSAGFPVNGPNRSASTRAPPFSC